MPFGRIGKSIALVLAVALFHATIPQVLLADMPARVAGTPAKQEPPAKPTPPTEQELAEMRLAEMEAPALRDFQAGAAIPLLVIVGLGIVAVVTFFWLVILPEKESPSTPDGYPHNTMAPEVNPEKKAIAASELDQLQQEAAANSSLGSFAAGR